MDTKFLHEALRNWQKQNSDSRSWEQLTQAERSVIMRDAQTLKIGAPPLTIDEVLDGIARSR